MFYDQNFMRGDRHLRHHAAGNVLVDLRCALLAADEVEFVRMLPLRRALTKIGQPTWGGTAEVGRKSSR